MKSKISIFTIYLICFGLILPGYYFAQIIYTNFSNDSVGIEYKLFCMIGVVFAVLSPIRILRFAEAEAQKVHNIGSDEIMKYFGIMFGFFIFSVFGSGIDKLMGFPKIRHGGFRELIGMLGWAVLCYFSILSRNSSYIQAR